MASLVIRPTAKFVVAATLVAGAVFVALEIAYLASWRESLPAWFPVLPVLILLWPALRAVGRLTTRTVIDGGRLSYETGAVGRSARTIQLSKVQDVRVDQTLFERLMNIGSVSIETAGEASRLTIANVDNPRKLANQILDFAQGKAATA
jgi:uncharacterized membrane protein YdbT with pleckstrin-like domain